MKVLTVLGTRPEIIRLSRVIEKLDRLCQQVVIHTGQNYDANLNDIFFEELGVRRPDHYLGVRGQTFGEQIGKILAASEGVLREERPDRVLILGDTNSSLVAVVAKRLGIPVYHMEAGNRCYDDRVPEEVNRRIIDHCSDVLMPYTERSRANLLREGIEGRRVYVTGNPIYEVIRHYDEQVRASNVHERLGLKPGGYFLVTMHREENVDVEPRLRSLVGALGRLREEYGLPILCSTHPRTRARMRAFGLDPEAGEGVSFHEPFGFFDFISLERAAFCVLSDSGTVQEECSIFRVANVTLRDVTERPETLECGSNMLSGVEPDEIMRAVRTVLDQRPAWTAPPEYTAENVSTTVARIVLGHLHSHHVRARQ
jgi:UDP-N-acetylglucosamine 2-epimerase (non-hydrolysing)